MTIDIDSSLCNGCSKCSKVCPLKVMEVNDINIAEVVRPSFCAHCAHCMSVCPTMAISGDFTDSVPGKSIKNLNMPSPEQVENLLLTRRSIRAYSSKNIEKEIIRKLLTITAHAPTARNAQDVHFIVVGPDKNAGLEILLQNYYSALNDDTIGTLTREAGYKILLGAPVTIALSSDKWNGEDDLNEPLWNCLIWAQNLLLAAHGLGLGGCYNGLLCAAYKNDTKFREFFILPEYKEIYMFLTIGYPDEEIKYLNIIDRKKPEIVWL